MKPLACFGALAPFHAKRKQEQQQLCKPFQPAPPSENRTMAASGMLFVRAGSDAAIQNFLSFLSTFFPNTCVFGTCWGEGWVTHLATATC
eukprot:141035-Chlamydomonas_euryale.AAC.10